MNAQIDNDCRNEAIETIDAEIQFNRAGFSEWVAASRDD